MSTVEDCLRVVPNKFELVLLASYRARTLIDGSSPLYDVNGKEKKSVVSLNEIGEGLLNIEETKKNIEEEIKEENSLKIYGDIRASGKVVVGSDEDSIDDIESDAEYEGTDEYEDGVEDYVDEDKDIE
ncbi:MAG: DNA-directed RNA polymerase subunit omega [Rickettsiales bacterium]|jgi:DNA-directed RNA polymerase subunit omega|nr:DNA-directed RNA polymerase subunit omega [Rickettsiales bacterium]